jgi:hydrogenase/urease accessory protein HupE
MIAVLIFFFCLFAPGAAAHDARPLAVTLVEEADGRLRLDWRAPGSVDAGNAPRARLAGCDPLHDEPPHGLAGRALYRCPDGFGAARLEIDYPWYNPSLSTLLRIDRGGVVETVLLAPDRLTWSAGTAGPAQGGGVAGGYFLLGVEHILIGIDHVLFLAGLLILARTPGRILLTVTGFTLAHSVTLILVALDVVRVSIPAVEATIALSVVFVAAEIARANRETLAWRRPAIAAAAFGLLHGAGFAAALGEIGLPAAEKVAALLFFNLGVEAGQLLLVAAALGGWAALRATARRLPARPAFATVDAGRTMLAYAIGIAAAFWCVERVAWAAA